MAAEIVWQGRFITVYRDERWEYVGRARQIGAAVILAVEDGHVLLVEQYRVPLGQRCLELPAGMVGDDETGETIEVAASRELEEETGWRAAHVASLGEFVTSPGLTSERFTLVRASGLTKVGPGGGVAGEDIVVHRVPVTELSAFIAAARARDVAIGVKLLMLTAGLLD